MFFTPIKMTIMLEDGRTVELEFGENEVCTIVSASSPLTLEEENLLYFKAGLFIGGGHKALDLLN